MLAFRKSLVSVTQQQQARLFSTTIPFLQKIEKSTRDSGESPKNYIQEDGELKIKVQPIPRPNESIDTKRRRLVYQSRKRGILESDLLLSRFAKKYLNTLTYDELVEYDQLLDEPDWDIYYWATKKYDVTPLPDKYKDSKILRMLQELSENKDREVLRMPELN